MDRLALLNEILAENPGDAFARYGLALEYRLLKSSVPNSRERARALW